ncbi:hypothetical protein V1478_016182 [Vespula squamosa]|uniref:Uncharacterized protein n=1 Tax=Vespula squamosa TaxID=30214 RepID=A0ABD1ZZ32_VESSQ
MRTRRRHCENRLAFREPRMNVGQHAGFPQDWSWQPAVVGFAFCFNIEQILTSLSSSAVSEMSTKDDNAHCHASEEKLKFSKATSVQLSR